MGMCGRFAVDQKLDELIVEFLAAHNRFPDWVPKWNIAPTTTIPVVIDSAEGRSLGPARWSLTPSWSDTLDTPYPTFNARIETAATKPTFRQTVAHHRALIPATAYYEWHTDGGVKTPHVIRPKDHSLFAFAGLYSVWAKGEQPVVTVTILTTDAADSVAWIHPRSPVALPRDSWSWWLDHETRGDQSLVDKAVEHSGEVFSHIEAYPVAPLRGDGPQLLSPRD
jgi:putative SOS response-associated peptidase YedK